MIRTPFSPFRRPRSGHGRASLVQLAVELEAPTALAALDAAVQLPEAVGEGVDEAGALGGGLQDGEEVRRGAAELDDAVRHAGRPDEDVEGRVDGEQQPVPELLVDERRRRPAPAPRRGRGRPLRRQLGPLPAPEPLAELVLRRRPELLRVRGEEAELFCRAGLASARCTQPAHGRCPAWAPRYAGPKGSDGT